MFRQTVGPDGEPAFGPGHAILFEFGLFSEGFAVYLPNGTYGADRGHIIKS